MGQGWQAIGLESASDLVHGIAEAGGLAGPVDALWQGTIGFRASPFAAREQGDCFSLSLDAQDFCARRRTGARPGLRQSLGYYELYVNGRKAGADVLSPAVSYYPSRSFYVTYDITPLLGKGRNCVGLWLGRGWHVAGRLGVSVGGPMLRFQAEMVAGGKKVEIASDETWRGAPSPYVTLGPWIWDQYGGERYDARLDNPAWSSADYNDRHWAGVEVLAPPAPVAVAIVSPEPHWDANSRGGMYEARKGSFRGGFWHEPFRLAANAAANADGWAAGSNPLRRPTLRDPHSGRAASGRGAEPKRRNLRSRPWENPLSDVSSGR